MKMITAYNDKYGDVAVFVDDEEWPELMKYKWYYCIDNSGTRKPDQETKPHISIKRADPKASNMSNLMVMHRHILGLEDPSIKIRHKDHNPLNNQKSNFRITIDGDQFVKIVRGKNG